MEGNLQARGNPLGKRFDDVHKLILLVLLFCIQHLFWERASKLMPKQLNFFLTIQYSSVYENRNFALALTKTVLTIGLIFFFNHFVSAGWNSVAINRERF